jgi:DNA-binding MarR family transcriptional regulator
LIFEVFHFARREFDEVVRPHGISAPQLAVLNRVLDYPGLSGAGLARHMWTTPQAAQLMLATLEEKGLVERQPDPDHGRIIRWTLTEAGHRTIDVCRPEVRKVERRLVGVLNPDERKLLIDLLQRLMSQQRRTSSGTDKRGPDNPKRNRNDVVTDG